MVGGIFGVVVIATLFKAWMFWRFDKKLKQILDRIDVLERRLEHPAEKKKR